MRNSAFLSFNLRKNKVIEKKFKETKMSSTFSSIKKIFGGAGRRSREDDRKSGESADMKIGAPTDVKRNIHVTRTENG